MGVLLLWVLSGAWEGPSGLRVRSKACIVFRVAPLVGGTKNPQHDARFTGDCWVASALIVTDCLLVVVCWLGVVVV